MKPHLARLVLPAAVVAGVAVTALPSTALAQGKTDFGEQGQFIVGADRLMPFFTYSHFSRSEPPGGGATDASQSGDNTTLGFFYGSTLDLNNNGNVQSDFPSSAFFTVPRVGLDYTFLPNVTVGGDVIVFFTLGGGRSNESTFANGSSMTSAQESRTLTLFGIAPRVGYVMHLTDTVHAWLRGGPSFYNGTMNTNTGGGATLVHDSQHNVALDLEPQLVWTPFPHVGFTGALDVDLGPSFLGGYSHQDVQIGNTTSGSADLVFLGLTLGMLAYF
jgi:hypothetical protein